MLSVGRETRIETKKFVCRECAWEGRGPELSTGLIRISHSHIYLYAYRCPACESFDMTAKGKLLSFRSRIESTACDGGQQSEQEGAPERRVAVEN